MHVYGVLSSSLDLNWLLKCVEFAENRIPIYDHDKCRPWVLLFIILAILLYLPLLHLAGDKENDSIDIEEEQSLKAREEEVPTGEIVQTSQDEVEEQASDRTTASGGVVVRRHGGCASCGDFSTTRCSRCKAARYWLVHLPLFADLCSFGSARIFFFLAFPFLLDSQTLHVLPNSI